MSEIDVKALIGKLAYKDGHEYKIRRAFKDQLTNNVRFELFDTQSGEERDGWMSAYRVVSDPIIAATLVKNIEPNSERGKQISKTAIKLARENEKLAECIIHLQDSYNKLVLDRANDHLDLKKNLANAMNTLNSQTINMIALAKERDKVAQKMVSCQASLNEFLDKIKFLESELHAYKAGNRTSNIKRDIEIYLEVD